MVSTSYMTTFFIFMVQDQLGDAMVGWKNNRASQSFWKVSSRFQATANDKQRRFVRIEPWVEPEQRICSRHRWSSSSLLEQMQSTISQLPSARWLSVHLPAHVGLLRLTSVDNRDAGVSGRLPPPPPHGKLSRCESVTSKPFTPSGNTSQLDPTGESFRIQSIIHGFNVSNIAYFPLQYDRQISHIRGFGSGPLRLWPHQECMPVPPYFVLYRSLGTQFTSCFVSCVNFPTDVAPLLTSSAALDFRNPVPDVNFRAAAVWLEPSQNIHKVCPKTCWEMGRSRTCCKYWLTWTASTAPLNSSCGIFNWPYGRVAVAAVSTIVDATYYKSRSFQCI